MQQPPLSDIDLSAWSFWERPREERFAAFATLRRERPVAWFPEPPDELGVPGPGFYALTRYADVAEVSARPDLYCSRRGAISINDLLPRSRYLFSSLVSTDAPRHTRIRRVVARAFTPRRIAMLGTHLQTLADELITEALVAAADEDGGFDLVERIAAPFPLIALCDLMGVPREYLEIVGTNSTLITAGLDAEYIPVPSERPGLLMAAARVLADLVEELVADRRRHPRDDVISALAGDDGLTPGEIASLFVFLCLAGNDTSRNSIAHGVVALSDDPEQAELWRSDPDRWTPRAVEEVVRWASPVMWMRRTVVEDVTLSGQPLHPGDKVVMLYGAANRDPAVFDDPDRFDLRRDALRHVGFGARGPHFCLGVHLARLEIGIMVPTLLARLPTLRVTGRPDRLRSLFFDGIKHLPVSPAPATAGVTA